MCTFFYNKKPNIATCIIHTSQEPNTTGAMMIPVYLTSIYAQKSLG